MFAVLGASGKIGRSTVKALRKAGVAVKAVLRDQSKAEPFRKLDCQIAVANLQDETALARALEGVSAAQIICPVTPQANDAAAEMKQSIKAMGNALESAGVPTVLAISDYGAELSGGTGVTALFYHLEERLRKTPCRSVFLRSAEHMENWGRVFQAATKTGVLPSLHHPLTKLFPTVSAFDVGAIAAELLLSSSEGDVSPRIVHAEGPRRYTPLDVAEAMCSVLGRDDIVAQALPRAEWSSVLRRGNLSESYAQLLTELYDAHNAGRINAQPGVGEIRRGQTTLLDAFRLLVENV